MIHDDGRRDALIGQRHIGGAGTLAATMTLEIPALGFKVKFDGDIKLQ